MGGQAESLRVQSVPGGGRTEQKNRAALVNNTHQRKMDESYGIRPYDVLMVLYTGTVLTTSHPLCDTQSV